MTILATFGTSDSGKTTLIESLTKTVMNKYSAEKVKSITLKVNYSSYKEEDKERYFLDLPGHKTFALESMRNLFNIDLPIYVLDSLKFKDLQKRKSILKHYLQHLALFNFLSLPHILLLNKAETNTKEELLEIFKTLKNNNSNFIAIYPVCALDEDSVSFLRKRMQKKIANLEIKDLKRENEPIFKTIKSFDVNPAGKWLSVLKGGILGGIRTAPLEIDKMYYYDKLLGGWQYVVIKDHKAVNEKISTIETLSDPYFFKNDQFKGTLFFSPSEALKAKDYYTDLLTVKIQNSFLQPHKDSQVHVIVDGQIASGQIKNCKNNILTIRLKKDSGLIFCPEKSKIIVFQETASNLEKIEILGLGHSKN